MLEGIDRELPNTRGFVLTQVKDSPLAQVLIQSLNPTPLKFDDFCGRTYGLGRTAVLTTDAGARWAPTGPRGPVNFWSTRPMADASHRRYNRFSMQPNATEGKSW